MAKTNRQSKARRNYSAASTQQGNGRTIGSWRWGWLDMRVISPAISRVLTWTLKGRRSGTTLGVWVLGALPWLLAQLVSVSKVHKRRSTPPSARLWNCSRIGYSSPEGPHDRV